jgi:acyl-coenzyme A synthetase/AMP-(fatty) acid ligase
MGFAAWARASAGLAGALGERGIGRGDVVALMLPSSIDYAICYAALARLGAITTGLNTRLGPREVAGILGLARPALVIRDARAMPAEPPPGIPVLERAELTGAYDHPAPVGGRPEYGRNGPRLDRRSLES